jgi:hypothetical protein
MVSFLDAVRENIILTVLLIAALFSLGFVTGTRTVTSITPCPETSCDTDQGVGGGGGVKEADVYAWLKPTGLYWTRVFIPLLLIVVGIAFYVLFTLPESFLISRASVQKALKTINSTSR